MLLKTICQRFFQNILKNFSVATGDCVRTRQNPAPERPIKKIIIFLKNPVKTLAKYLII